MEYTGLDFDYDSQMAAISALLYRLEEADDNLAVDIESKYRTCNQCWRCIPSTPATLLRRSIITVSRHTPWSIATRLRRPRMRKPHAR